MFFLFDTSPEFASKFSKLVKRFAHIIHWLCWTANDNDIAIFNNILEKWLFRLMKIIVVLELEFLYACIKMSHVFFCSPCDESGRKREIERKKEIMLVFKRRCVLLPSTNSFIDSSRLPIHMSIYWDMHIFLCIFYFLHLSLSMRVSEWCAFIMYWRWDNTIFRMMVKAGEFYISTSNLLFMFLCHDLIYQ